jgi:hypothetical protein
MGLDWLSEVVCFVKEEEKMIERVDQEVTSEIERKDKK